MCVWYEFGVCVWCVCARITDTYTPSLVRRCKVSTLANHLYSWYGTRCITGVDTGSKTGGDTAVLFISPSTCHSHLRDILVWTLAVKLVVIRRCCLSSPPPATHSSQRHTGVDTGSKTGGDTAVLFISPSTCHSHLRDILVWTLAVKLVVIRRCCLSPPPPATRLSQRHTRTLAPRFWKRGKQVLQPPATKHYIYTYPQFFIASGCKNFFPWCTSRCLDM